MAMFKKTKPLIIANWKMNPETEQEAKNILSETKEGTKNIKGLNIVVCPPIIFMDSIKKALGKSKNIFLGAQDAFVGSGSSHTGEVGLNMIKKVGAKYIIVGHSERREVEDTEEEIREKVLNILKNDLKVILCIGEKERSEHGHYYNEVKIQLTSALSGLQKKYTKNLILAYEPVWAIGNKENNALNPENLYEMAIFIKKTLNDIFGQEIAKNISILYGGSVNKNNAKDLLENGKVNGLLIGRESLNTPNFIEIIQKISN
jgi:triosephosphate isomerase